MEETSFAEKKAYALKNMDERIANYSEEELNRPFAISKSGNRKWSVFQVREEIELETTWGLGLIEMEHRFRLRQDNKKLTEK
jgi:hypothetical protein